MDEIREGRYVPLEATPENVAKVQASITRKCGECTACCFTFANEQLQKPQSCWCSHATKKGGCSIYPARPTECRNFFCDWLQGNFDERDRPDKVGVVFDVEPCAHLMLASVFGFDQRLKPMLRCTQLRPGAAWQPRARELVLARSHSIPITIRGFREDPDVDLVVEGQTYHLKHVEFLPEPESWVCWAEEPMATQLVEAMAGKSSEEKRALVTQGRDDVGGQRAASVAMPGVFKLTS